MRIVFDELPLELTAGLFFLLGLCVGNGLVKWIVRLTPPGDGAASSAGTSDPRRRRWPLYVPLLGGLLSRGRLVYRDVEIGRWGPLVELGTGLLFAGFVVAMVGFECQKTPEVSPAELWRHGRIVYHLVLISLLVAATGADFRDYVIPDAITIPGVCIGVAAATLSGDLQIIHVWVDWNDPLVPIQGPYIPEWIKQHPHWHGLAWSTAGAFAGAGMTWLVRALSSLILARPALGMGDVTLMAMIGSFVGWQPVVFIFLLAPLCGLAVGLAVRLLTGRTFVPYGPYLSLATVVVLFTWRWIWTLEIAVGGDATFSIRRLFGDWIALAITAEIAIAALVVLLGLVRLYRTIPVDRRG